MYRSYEAAAVKHPTARFLMANVDQNASTQRLAERLEVK
jgi:hypothetical protein